MQKIIFVDTNILIYAHDKSEKKKHLKALNILKQVTEGNKIIAISTQILSEFFSVITKRKYLTIEQGYEIIRDLIDYDDIIVHTVTPNTISEAIILFDKAKTSFWDAQIAATMLENNIQTIYTENTKDFKNIEGIKAINPLK